ncbi:uncharacterized protein LOC131204594 [Ahaetulla prasina]|uniref:uncharacterized protein LOC131204594 n=1 Tax=Ahaetulla prasina TaxID=499056 RepID=UPI0026473E55|nr:uncharacterized protein LOC131204594 [Ahaetulla prasina]
MMASFVLFIFTIFLLPVARYAEATKCLECFNDGGIYCSNKERNCTDGEKCVGIISRAKLSREHALSESLAKTCVASANHLEGAFHFNFGDRLIFEFDSQVCDDPDTYCPDGLAGDSMRIYENGKSCPKCFRTGYDNCTSKGEVLCMGDLVNCIEVNGEISSMRSGTKIPFAGKGCVSRSVCDLEGKSVLRGTYIFTFKKLQCSKANVALPLL